MDWYGASIISDMQPQTTTQGRIRDTPLKKRLNLVMPKAETKYVKIGFIRKELCPLVADVLSKNSYKLALLSENASAILSGG